MVQARAVDGSKPRVWPCVLVLLGVLPTLLLSGVAAAILAVLVLSARGEPLGADEIQAFFEERPGFLAGAMLSQLAFLALAVVPAVLSPVPFRERLGLVRGRLAPRSLPLLALGTLPILMLCMCLFALLFEEPSEHLLLIDRMFREAPLAWALVLTLAFSVVPGIVEETLFRGYVQRRLLERFRAGPAIGVVSLSFAAAHFDVQHAVGVLPLAFWLGYVAWRSASTVPGIVCHAAVNAFAFALTASGLDGGAEAETLNWPLLLGIGAAALPFLVLSVVRLERAGRGAGHAALLPP
jgi:membrane protease YdiL (CAAX protease family)